MKYDIESAHEINEVRLLLAFFSTFLIFLLVSLCASITTLFRLKVLGLAFLGIVGFVLIAILIYNLIE